MWSVVSTKPFFHFSESSVHESSVQARVLWHSWRGMVPPPGLSWGRCYVSGLQFRGTSYAAPLLSWLLWGLLLTVRYTSQAVFKAQYNFQTITGQNVRTEAIWVGHVRYPQNNFFVNFVNSFANHFTPAEI